jgi:hypothetical protein
MASLPGSITLPPVNGQFDYQINGSYTPASGVQIVDRDNGDTPAAGLYNICYMNTFQTQPENKTFWMDEHSDLLLRNANGDVRKIFWLLLACAH